MRGGVMEFVVEGTPEVCLGLARSYFESEEWPYSAESSVYGPGITRREVGAIILNRSIWFSGCLGVGAFLLLTIVTGGTFFLLWVIWVIFLKEDFDPQVAVTADAVGPSQTRIVVKWQRRPELAPPVEEWVQRELVENRTAAPEPTATPGLTDQDIPEQIGRLAKLRDAGAITSEEFETKKRELLDRM